MKSLLLILALILPLTGATPRKTCTHGCESKYCKKATCGKTCKLAPCRGCWKR